MPGPHILHQQCGGYIYFTNNVGATYISPTLWGPHVFYQHCEGYKYFTNNVGAHTFHQHCGSHIYFTNNVRATYISPTTCGPHIIIISPTMWGLHIFHQQCGGHICFTNNVGATYISPTTWGLHIFHQQSDMGLGKSEKGGKWCGGLGAAVGPQWGPGAKPLVGVWGQRPQKLKVFSVCHHKKQHSGAWKSDICKSASFMFRPDIYLAILKIALKMSFWKCGGKKKLDISKSP